MREEQRDGEGAGTGGPTWKGEEQFTSGERRNMSRAVRGHGWMSGVMTGCEGSQTRVVGVMSAKIMIGVVSAKIMTGCEEECSSVGRSNETGPLSLMDLMNGLDG